MDRYLATLHQRSLSTELQISWRSFQLVTAKESVGVCQALIALTELFFWNAINDQLKISGLENSQLLINEYLSWCALLERATPTLKYPHTRSAGIAIDMGDEMNLKFLIEQNAF